MLDDAERQGAGLTEVFSMIGIFSVLAGILLLINLFVMLAEERKTELGMLRAVGFTRRRLTRAFAIEGAFYAIAAAALGAVAGLGIGWLVAFVAGPIFGAAEGSSYPLVIEPMSLAIGASTGLVISLVTIWVTSLRIARLNIIRAIRDLPEPKIARARTRTMVLGAVGIVVGAAAASLGYLEENPFALVLGVPVMAFSAAPLLRRLLPERTARLLVAGTVLAWGLAVYPLFPDIMGGSDMLIFVVQGVVLTVGAVSLASSLDRVWTFAVEHLGRGGRGLAPRLGIAYPLARRFRTSMLLGMFSLVIFTVTILTSFSIALASNTDATVERVAAGFDVLVDTNPTNPVDAQALAARDDVVAVAGLTRGVANFGAAHLDGTPEWAISGFDLDLLRRGTPGLFRRDEAYASDAEVYRAVLNDPSLAIVPENFLVAGVDVAVLDVGDTFTVIEPGSGQPRELTIAALGETDWLENGALVSRELTTALFGERDIVTRYYLGVADGADADAVASSVNAAFLAQGADADTFCGAHQRGCEQAHGLPRPPAGLPRVRPPRGDRRSRCRDGPRRPRAAPGDRHAPGDGLPRRTHPHGDVVRGRAHRGAGHGDRCRAGTDHDTSAAAGIGFVRRRPDPVHRAVGRPGRHPGPPTRGLAGGDRMARHSGGPHPTRGGAADRRLIRGGTASRVPPPPRRNPVIGSRVVNPVRREGGSHARVRPGGARCAGFRRRGPGPGAR